VWILVEFFFDVFQRFSSLFWTSTTFLALFFTFCRDYCCCLERNFGRSLTLLYRSAAPLPHCVDTYYMYVFTASREFYYYSPPTPFTTHRPYVRCTLSCVKVVAGQTRRSHFFPCYWNTTDSRKRFSPNLKTNSLTITNVVKSIFDQVFFIFDLIHSLQCLKQK